MYDVKTTTEARNRVENLRDHARNLVKKINTYGDIFDNRVLAELVEASCEAILAEMNPTSEGVSEEERELFLEEARSTWGLNENIAIDSDAAVSAGEGGAGWVQAWVWVDIGEGDEDE